MATLSEIIENIKNLNLDEIEEINHITGKYIIEKRRSEIHFNHQESLKEYNQDRLDFSSDLDELKSSLDLE